MNTRDGIQWLRAIAIVSILLFHLWPKIFLHGYLGIDIFFVLSGYHTTKVLCNPSTKSTVFVFYVDQIKRIFPTFLFVIILTLFIGNNFFRYNDFWSLLIEAVWSVCFINNLSPLFSNIHYFDMVTKQSENKFLLHTWFLAIGIHFYLMAPFLLKFFNTKDNPLRWIFVGIILSLLSQILMPFPHITYGLIFCRIWQFLIGSAVYYQSLPKYYLLEKCFSKSCIKRCQFILWIMVILICWNPFQSVHEKFNDSALRILVTFLIGILLVMNELNTITVNEYLNKFLVYIGEASYSLYLVHWPLIAFFKYFRILNACYYLLAISVILVTTIVIHETFEKTLITQSWTINGIVILVCYIAIFLTVAKLRPREPEKYESELM